MVSAANLTAAAAITAARTAERKVGAMSRSMSAAEAQVQRLEQQLGDSAQEREGILEKLADALRLLAETRADVAERQQQLNEALTEVETTRHEKEEQEADFEEQLQELQVEKEAALNPAPGRGAKPQPALRLAQLQPEIGLPSKTMSVPPRTRPDNDTDWEKNVTRHLAAVLEGRGEDEEGLALIAEALHRCGYTDSLMGTHRFQRACKALARKVVGSTTAHWTPRHAVHVWDRLELSRNQMETLSHLLSDIYDAEWDKYRGIRAWENPHDESDYVLVAKLAGRVLREREYHEIAMTRNITVGANGRCERDTIKCASLLYSNYSRALRDDFSLERPAQPVLFFDGTGSSLGRGLCHGELGCADFKAVDDVDARQSRSTLQPLFAYQGNDHANDLRGNLELAIDSYNKLVMDGKFNRTVERGGEVVTESIPARAITVGDMQGGRFKTTPHHIVRGTTRDRRGVRNLVPF
jgi:hypothetical protein